MKAVIFDIDGTLSSNNTSREFALNKEWDKFFAAIGDDAANQWALDLIQACLHMNWMVLFVTGRSDKLSAVTSFWLQSKFEGMPDFDWRLFMRKEGDKRPDCDIKAEIYDNEIKGRYKVQFVVEDRQRVVDMWREKGLVCLQCAKGDY